MKRFTLMTVLVVVVSLAGLPLAFAQNDTQAEASAFVRFANLSPDAGALSLSLVEAATAGEALEFGEFSDWQAVPAGDYTVSVTASAGDVTSDTATQPTAEATTEPASEATAEPTLEATTEPASQATGQVAIVPATYLLGGGQWTTIVAVGATADGSLSTVAVQEDYSPMPPGVSNVTFFNGLVGDGVVNFVRDETEFVSELGGPNNAAGLSSSSSFPLDAGTYRFFAHPTDNTETGLGELVDSHLNENDLYFLAAVVNPSGENVLILEPTRWAEVEMALGNLTAPGGLIDVAGSHSLLPLFAQALEQAGLNEVLTGETMYTLFAPSDDVMNGLLEQYANDSEGLATFLRDHIVEGDLRFNDLANMESVTTLNGTSLPLRVDDKTVYVNEAPILTPNVSAMNGTIHIVGGAATQ